MLKEHNWHQLKDDTAQRLNQLAPYFRDGKIIDAKDTVAALEAVIRSFDRVNIEGNNQKQADFLSECLCQLDPQRSPACIWCSHPYRCPAIWICLKGHR